MKKKSNSFLIAGLDIGTSKVHALIAECTPELMEIIALGTSPSYGLKKGVVTNIEATTQSIQQAVAEAERMAGIKIQEVYTCIAGSHIRSLNSYGVIAIANKEVTQRDIDRVMESARAVPISEDQKQLHVLPQEFIVDYQHGIRDPIGMSGVRLETKVHIITGALNAAQNIVKCVQKCNLNVADIVVDQLASSQSVLTEDEKELGVILVDIGGGSTDIAVFKGGTICHTAVVSIAGDHITRDIAVLLNTSIELAESIKRKDACAMLSMTQTARIEISNLSSHHAARNIETEVLTEVVSARYEEIFILIRQALGSFSNPERVPAGLVLTGGASHVLGATELAQALFKMHVRIGVPQYQGNMESTFGHGCHSTGVGLIYHGYQHMLHHSPMSTIQSTYNRMRAWFQNNF